MKHHKKRSCSREQLRFLLCHGIVMKQHRHEIHPGMPGSNEEGNLIFQLMQSYTLNDAFSERL